jgi:hypothetical protein
MGGHIARTGCSCRLVTGDAWGCRFRGRQPEDLQRLERDEAIAPAATGLNSPILTRQFDDDRVDFSELFFSIRLREPA